MINGQTLIIKTADGRRLKAHYFQGSTEASIVVASATACPQRLYFKMAEYLSRQGFHVYTFDYSGVGESKSVALRKEDSDMLDWGARDLNAVLELALERHQRAYLFTHSIGGQIFCFAEKSENISGVYCMASQSAYYRHWSGISKWKVLLFWKLLLPLSTGVLGYMPGFVMGSPESLSAPAALSWRSFAHNPRGSLGIDSKAMERASNLSVPMKFIGLQKDNLLSPSSAVKALAAEFPKAKTEILLPNSPNWVPLGHFDFFRSKHQELWKDPLRFFRNCEAAFKIEP